MKEEPKEEGRGRGVEINNKEEVRGIDAMKNVRVVT